MTGFGLMVTNFYLINIFEGKLGLLRPKSKWPSKAYTK